MEPSVSISAFTVLACGTITVALAGLTLAFQSVLRRRARALERDSNELAHHFARFLTGGVDGGGLREVAAGAGEEIFWAAVARFTDNVAGEEWSRLSQELRGLPYVEQECARLTRGPLWRRAIAARQLGMLDDPAGRQALRQALELTSRRLRLRVLLSLARLGDRMSLEWLIRHPDAFEGVAPTIAVALLKRYGPECASYLRPLLEADEPRGGLVVAAAEVLGVWRDGAARAGLESLMDSPGLEERVAAARALGHLGEPRSAPRLAAALSDGAWQVRAQAARALGKVPASSAVPALAAATRDRSWWVRRNACYALAGQGDDGLAALTRVARDDPDRYAREMAVEALQALAWEGVSPGGIGRVG